MGRAKIGIRPAARNACSGATVPIGLRVTYGVPAMAAARPAAAALTPAELGVLLDRAGLTLNPGQVADLVLVWRQLAGMVAQLPRDRKLADDQAYVFRLPVPDATPRHAAPRLAAPRLAAPRLAAPRPAAAKPPARPRAKRPPAAKKKR